MRRCRFHVIMPNVPGTPAGFSKLSQPFERMKLAEYRALDLALGSNAGLSAPAEMCLLWASLERRSKRWRGCSQ